jgi:phenylpropionate dioxygenase-like ring-hydroxylating dioxygenase large terminal subunit
MDAREDPTSAGGCAVERPPADRPPRFPAVPVGWYPLCRGRDLTPGPARREVGGRSYVGFRDAAGRPAALDGACSHLGASLACGAVVGGRIRCPLHGWEYDRDGLCAHIPAGGPVPPFAVQTAYPTAEVGPEVVFCNDPTAPYPFPFFDGVGPDDLLAADPFEFDVNVPWYMIGANAFDLQHFRVAHDRTLVGDPVVDHPAPFARRIAADFDVTGTSWRDQVTRRFSGPRVRMTVTSWAGTSCS